MQIVKETIEITRTARYFVLGEPGPQIQRLWFVCHGYGQLAQEFLEGFRVLEDSRTLIIAPEGLHRFYVGGTGRRVGASWMTKEERTADITDYVSFLDAIYAKVMAESDKKPEEVKIDILGFSQGAATAWRWAMKGKCLANRLILWAGDVPPDTQWESCKSRLKQMELLLVFGDKDPLMKPNFFHKQKEVLDYHKINFRSESFDGFHEIKPEMLKKMKEKLK